MSFLCFFSERILFKQVWIEPAAALDILPNGLLELRLAIVCLKLLLD
jgi:hypothetical protein